MQAVDGLGEDAGAGGFTDAARAAEKIGMGQLSALDGRAERGGDMLLADDRRAGGRTVFARADDEITHSNAKDTKSRVQCQIYLAIAEAQYLRRSQRHENFLLAQ